MHFHVQLIFDLRKPLRVLLTVQIRDRASWLEFRRVLFRSCDPMDCSTPGFPVLHYLPKLAQTNVYRVSDAIQPSHHLWPPAPPAFNLSQHQGLFQESQLFTSGGQNIGASASASVLPMNIQGWFPLGLTGLISLQFKGLSRVFSSTTVQKQQFFGTQPS